MKILMENEIWALRVVLRALKLFGILVSSDHRRHGKIFLFLYWLFFLLFTSVTYMIFEIGDLVQIWGDIPLTASTSVVLFENVVFAVKIIFMRFRQNTLQRIINESDQELKEEDRAEGRDIINKIKLTYRCDRETGYHLQLFMVMGTVTAAGWAWAGSVDEEQAFPVRAWYPYDAFKSPAYELTYLHQSVALFLIVVLHISMDTMMCTLIGICRCRLKLVGLSFRDLYNGMDGMKLTPQQEATVNSRLRKAVIQHQAVLCSIDQLQTCFSELTLVQCTISMVVICVTAFELTYDLKHSTNVAHIAAMLAYQMGMIFQVFLFCYQGDHLASESLEISYAAYSCEWYRCSISIRRALLVVMARAQAPTQLIAGGFTPLSLACFSSIVKTSYTFLTVLQQVENS